MDKREDPSEPEEESKHEMLIEGSGDSRDGTFQMLWTCVGPIKGIVSW